VTACFNNECEFWGQEIPEPNLIVPLRPYDPSSVRSGLQVIQTLMRVLVLTMEIKKVIEPEKDPCASGSKLEANWLINQRWVLEILRRGIHSSRTCPR
jgi:hypothetical protein